MITDYGISIVRLLLKSLILCAIMSKNVMGENKMRYIRNKFGDIIYCIRDDGTITDKFDCDVIGHLKSDRITDKFDIDTLFRIRQDGTITDKYDCDIIGHIREDGSITDKYDIGTQGRVDVPNSSSGSSDSGCLSSLLSLVVLVIGGLLKLLWPLIKIYFIAIWLPCVVAPSLFGWASGMLAILCVPVGLMLFTYLFVAITGVPFFLFMPYWAVLMWQKIKKQMTWKEVCSYYWKWFLKGPFAYLELTRTLNNNKSMPQVASLLDKIINWFKKIFKKK